MTKNKNKNKNLDIKTLAQIEKWVLDDSYTDIYNTKIVRQFISNAKIKKEQKLNVNSVTITSKMIIKIQCEIIKRYILNHINDIHKQVNL